MIALQLLSLLRHPHRAGFSQKPRPDEEHCIPFVRGHHSISNSPDEEHALSPPLTHPQGQHSSLPYFTAQAADRRSPQPAVSVGALQTQLQPQQTRVGPCAGLLPPASTEITALPLQQLPLITDYLFLLVSPLLSPSNPCHHCFGHRVFE